MVNIHRHELAAAASDEEALELFRRQWAIYQKLIDSNYLNHVEAYRILHRVLTKEVETPFRVLDLACGDAVRTCDLPEAISTWIALGHDAGFTAADELFKAPSDLFRMFCYRP